MRFVKLTTVDGLPVYVNLLLVTELLELDGKTWIYWEDNSITVKEKPEDILIKLPSIGG